jgi:hypothetical protein
MLQSRARTEYRRKALDYLSRARSLDDPEKRAEMLWLAKMWMSLTEPLGEMPGAYEFPQNGLLPPDNARHARYQILSRSRPNDSPE